MTEPVRRADRGTMLRGGTAGPVLLTLAGFLIGMLAVFVVSVDMMAPGLGWVLMSFGLAVFLLGATWGFWRSRPTLA